MAQFVTIEQAEAQRILALLQRIKQEVAQVELRLSLLGPAPRPGAQEDIFAEMAGVAAHAPEADDSREAIYTRMPGE